jgi:nicotinamidase-related amidase
MTVIIGRFFYLVLLFIVFSLSKTHAFEMIMAASTVSKIARVGKIRPPSTTFLLCDIQERFRPLMYHGETIVSTAQYLSSMAKELQIPIIATQQYTKVFGPTVTDVFANGQEGLDDLISKGRVFDKKKFSMMTEEVVACLNTIEFKDRDSFVLFGIEAHVCVQQTCLDLLELGKEVHIILDGISSQQSYDREIALKRMENAGAYITTAQSLAFMLMESADHENFKAVSKLTVEHMKKPNQFNDTCGK